MDDIDVSLARVTTRLKAARDQAQALFAMSPELADLREIKKRLNGKVEWVACSDWEWGRDVRGIPIKPYRPPQVSKRGRIKNLREMEQAE